MENITRSSLEQALERIDANPHLLKRRESDKYDLLVESGKRYPPILVLSEANKILGGNELTIRDFNNSTREAFQILTGFDYQIVPKISERLVKNEDFDYKKFLDANTLSNLIFSEQLVIRFIAALITKPFVILTGLSGSGKTKLAIAFAKWMAGDIINTTNRFSVGDKVKSNRVTYIVESTDNLSVTFVQPESGIKAILPYELIEEWIEAINENNFTQETSPRKIRDIVEQSTKYSPQLNSFETHLKAAAFFLISSKKSDNHVSVNSSVCLVPVGADWTNREPLLGFPNALETSSYVKPENRVLDLIIAADKNPQKPYFLILDEMNLSHVERYFADFLSVMESKGKFSLHAGVESWNGIPPEIHLPSNLFIIGTVNIDETTYMFSPKVLDRASVIEFRVTSEEMNAYLTTYKKHDSNSIIGNGAGMEYGFVNLAKDETLEVGNVLELNNLLISFFKELKKTGAEFGYRTASEIIRFAAVIKRIAPDWSIDDIMDAAIMQKLLPKVHGSRRKLEPVLKALGSLCLQESDKISEFISAKSDIDYTDRAKIKYPISLEKILRMNASLLNNGFTSFAEA